MKLIRSFFLAIIPAAIPLFLMMTAIRLLINPFFLTFEYNFPGFPADPYGFSKDDRIHYANISIKYLVNDEGIDFLGDLVFADGQSVFNERELDHMEDVKDLVQLMIRVWLGIGGLLLVSIIWAWRGKWLSQFWSAISKGGWFTLGLVALILVGVAVSFSALFTGFHLLFFEGDTWLFFYSDTLIRLFPMRFWQDAFILMGVLTISAGLALALLGRRWSKE
jgi:integral membrane protein (TIGR01906 family)